MDKKPVNKDLILRESLAIERTKMANDRTLLSFIRTSLYFSIAGITINSLLHLAYGREIEAGFIITALVVLAVGIYKYRQSGKKIRESRNMIGGIVDEYENGD